MRTTNRPTLVGMLCCIGVLLCIFCMGKIAVDFVMDARMNEVESYTEHVTIIETFYTTDRYGRPEYHIMWEGNGYADIMSVCSGCYMKYREAAEMPIKVVELESKNRHGFNFCLHNHYNYERTNK